jgi:hypothetical protein
LTVVQTATYDSDVRTIGGAAGRIGVIALALLVAGGGTGHADGATAGAKPPDRIHVQVYADDDLAEPARRAIEAAAADGVRRQAAGADVVTSADLPVDTAAETAASKALARSDKGLDEAKKRVKNLEEGALDMLDWAAEEYARYLPELMARDGNANRLIEVYIQSAIASFLAGDNEGAAKSLRRALVLEPDLDYDPQVFPPQLEELVIQERLMFDELGRGALEVTATGGDPVVFINGIERGKAPVTVDDLPPGPTVVNLVVPGAQPVFVLATVEGEKTNKVSGEVELPSSAVVGPLAGSRGDVGAERANKKLRAAAKKLEAGGLVLVLPRVTGGGVELVAYAYDMRSGALVGRTESTVDAGNPGPAAEKMAEELMASVVWKPSIDLRVGKSDPFWKHKYFWPAVGATAGVVALVVVIKVATGGLSNGEKVGLFPVVRF